MTLAALAGDKLSIALVSKIERGIANPSLATLDYLARRLDVSVGLLLDGAISRRAASRAALDRARSRLLLGDPAGAAIEAEAAAGEAAGVLRARLGGVAAEAHLTANRSDRVAQLLQEASAVLGALPIAQADTYEVTLSRAELSWTLGLAARSHGALGDAHRAWAASLGLLESLPHLAPSDQYLRAAVMGELGTLYERNGEYETARNLVARAASVAANLAQASGPAQALLALEGAGEPVRLPSPVSTLRDDLVHPLPAMALGLAAVAAAERLSRHLTIEVTRLERAATTSPARTALPDTSHSRHLR
jgi:transcriptional regulator with XRE-family HTH domain